MLFKFKIWSDTFLGVALWTFIWAICATIFTFSFGFILALALAKKITFRKGLAIDIYTAICHTHICNVTYFPPSFKWNWSG